MSPKRFRAALVHYIDMDGSIFVLKPMRSSSGLMKKGENDAGSSSKVSIRFQTDRAEVLMDPAYAPSHERIMKRLNRSYFRSRFVGFEKPILDRPGAPIIYASNHSGMAFPWDGMALYRCF